MKIIYLLVAILALFVIKDNFTMPSWEWWQTYLLGVLVGVGCGLIIAYILLKRHVIPTTTPDK